MTQVLELVQDQAGHSEDRLFGFEFKNFSEIVAGQTLASVLEITQAPADPLGQFSLTPLPVTIGSVVIGGTQVQVEIFGGSPGTQYLLWCRCLTNLGSKLTCRGVLDVEN